MDFIVRCREVPIVDGAAGVKEHLAGSSPLVSLIAYDFRRQACSASDIRIRLPVPCRRSPDMRHHSRGLYRSAIASRISGKDGLVS